MSDILLPSPFRRACDTLRQCFVRHTSYVVGMQSSSCAESDTSFDCPGWHRSKRVAACRAGGGAICLSAAGAGHTGAGHTLAGRRRVRSFLACGAAAVGITGWRRLSAVLSSGIVSPGQVLVSRQHSLDQVLLNASGVRHEPGRLIL